MRLLETINSPKDLKKLSIKELEEVCSQIREHIISCCAQNPGHIGASLGAVELAVALHYVFDTPGDKIIWDVGHQAYAHKIITGRRDAFLNNRKLNGISGFPKRAESEYDAFGTGHSATSISAALGMAIASQLEGKSNKVVAVIGDGAMTGGLAFEGLNNAGSMKSDLLVILNDNQISIDANTGALHNYLIKISTSQTYNHIKNKVWDFIGSNCLRRHLQKALFSTKMALFKNGSLFESLGFRYFGAIDGNDIGQLVTTLSNIKRIKGPKILHIRTKKGKGFLPAEIDESGWHAPGKFDAKSGRKVSSKSDVAKFQEVFGETLLELARSDRNIVGITPAMASGCSMNIMMKEMPERIFDVGIAEQHAATFAAGLAAEGLLPFCNIYSSFAQRAYDNIIHDIAIQNLKVILCFDRSGIVGEDGATHHGYFDMAAFRPVPNLTIMAPYDEEELRNMMYSATRPEYRATIIRYPRGKGSGARWRKEPFTYIERGKGRMLHQGKDIVLLSIGAIGVKGSEAVRKCSELGIEVSHYDMRFLKPLDTGLLEEATGHAKTVITLEDGMMKGGLHSAVAEYIAEKHKDCTLTGLGIPDQFVEQGTPEELYSLCKFNTEDIVRTIVEHKNRDF